ncbi:MarR family winged helix-turn-helix transcriptional regulator [Maledivibacter halophilus]|uniref:DNA-binding transcriptional regulator, MarR family n=1 Tax=Maledivibacter halophilus TaxID=36842 RepID=A0A1T5MFM0_9FIRM|nr:MarR family transcriptional regulator [Maledivibacter halophilus]SKC87030.1 DNA-binding transcriptional regulator, MarR family [Maledivibacter halophilus]
MENIYEELGKWISLIYRQFQIYINNELKDLNITSSEYIFLIKLYENKELNQEKLSSMYYIDKALTARSLKKLERKGYIKRYKDEDDKRAYRICVTNKALSIKSRIDGALNSWDKIISVNISNDEIKEVSRVLKDMSLRALEKSNDKK